MVLDCCGVDHESLPKTTSLLPGVENKLMIRSDQSCSDARNGMSGFAATDTRWSGQKNGSESANPWIDIITGKVLMYANVIKDERRNPYSNFTGTSNMMESQGLRKCLSNMNDDHTLNQITSIARDMDNKSWYILEEYGSNKDTVLFDPGHYRKSFGNRWCNFTEQYKNFEYTEHGVDNVIKQPFRGLLPHLKHWLNIVLKIEDDNLRIKEWENFPYHLVGMHDYGHQAELEDDILWQTGVNHSILIGKLLEFITNESAIIRKISTKNTTQQCESFNAELGRVIPKTFTNYHYQMGGCSTMIKHNELKFYNDFLEITRKMLEQNR